MCFIRVSVVLIVCFRDILNADRIPIMQQDPTNASSVFPRLILIAPVCHRRAYPLTSAFDLILPLSRWQRAEF